MFDYINDEEVLSEYMSLETLVDAVNEWKNKLPSSRQYLANNVLEIIDNALSAIINAPDFGDMTDALGRIEEILR